MIAKTRLHLQIIVASMMLLSGVAPASAEQLLIANTSVGVETLSLNTTRLLFSMQLPQWRDGTVVRVFVLPDDHPRHRAFSKDLLSLYPRQLRRVWDRQLYSGTGQAPTTVADEEAMRNAIANTPGAIGYLSREMIDDTVNEIPIRR